MAGLFGTSGIRGVYGKEVTPELAMKVGNAAGAGCDGIAVAMDARATSPVLSNALCAGANQAGARVLSLGLAPTPLLAYATMVNGCQGAMITASHNPPEYNGIKLFLNGMEFTREEESKVESAIGKPPIAVQWDMAGGKEDIDISSDYIRFILSKVDAAAIAERKPRVLVDAGNAAASYLAPALLRAAGCDVVGIYCNSPGKFARNLEPKTETLSDAARVVIEKKCDLGVAFDGDGDRAIVIDERGRVFPLDCQLAVFCRNALESPKSKSKLAISTVEASLCIRETVESLGGKLEITPVGSLHIAMKLLEKKAAFGGEPCGEYVFPGATPCADGLLAALTAVEIFCRKGRLSALMDSVKAYPIERRKYKCEGKDKEKIMAGIASALEFREDARLSRLDGLRFDFSDGWLLVRPSGTEPAIRLTCEFRDKKRLAEIAATAGKAIDAAIGKTC